MHIEGHASCHAAVQEEELRSVEKLSRLAGEIVTHRFATVGVDME